ncbi:hypothetical protein FXO38_32511 [Capsicum annuum]|uniref:Uncharacterized protein n=1 Tax=Capsicum annuum TaxID=4072 RepID=A0A2G2ZXD6_CAPAN|nr:hypothetical protein FXO38_32511 [Capsicum annuum]KAF3672359.1 hypothetical protein FXO37_07554 [Capsicum annuum]PHT86626.1 hypothetical protein T459_08732 [Capsicum annuum]
MGIMDLMNFGKETMKKVCEISCDNSIVAIRKMDDVVRVKGLQKLSEYMADDEGRAKMVHFTAKFIKNVSVFALREAANILIPG